MPPILADGPANSVEDIFLERIISGPGTLLRPSEDIILRPDLES